MNYITYSENEKDIIEKGLTEIHTKYKLMKKNVK